MGVYVASKFIEIADVREVQDALLTAGFNITHDWTHEDMEKAVNNPGYFVSCASADLRGVRAARILVIIPQLEMRGGYVEIGAALISNIPVVAYFPRHLDNLEARIVEWRAQIFSHLCETAYSMEELIGMVSLAHDIPPIGLPFAACNERISHVRP